MKCFKCGEMGHYATQCSLMEKDKDEKQDPKVATRKDRGGVCHDNRDTSRKEVG